MLCNNSIGLPLAGPHFNQTGDHLRALSLVRSFYPFADYIMALAAYIITSPLIREAYLEAAVRRREAALRNMPCVHTIPGNVYYK